MAIGNLRTKLQNFEIDMAKKENLLNECRYFASIAPRPLTERFKGGIGKIKEVISEHTVISLVLLIVFFPLWMMMLSVLLPMGMLTLFVLLLALRANQTPEYKAYNYCQKISEPTLKLFDDNLKWCFHYNVNDLVDTDMSYDDALVEAHMVVPFNKKCHARSFSYCSYNWDDATDLDSFEYVGYKIFREWEDSDNQTHEEVFFNGAIYKFHTSFTFNGTVNIMSTKTTGTLFGGEKEHNKFKAIKDREVVVIDTENHEFAEKFDTVATYDAEAYRYLTPALIEALLDLRKYYFFSICIKGNVMTVTVDGGFNYAKQSALGDGTKPFSAPPSPEAYLDYRIGECRNALLSVYELKDILDPGARQC